MINEDLAAAMTAAALRQQQAARPMFGRQEGMVTRVPEAAVENTMSLPRRAFGAAQQYVDTGEYNPEPVFDAATTAMTGGIGGAVKGAAGAFGGKLSSSANLGALEQAQQMKAARVSPEQIWNDTGWVQRRDKQWRFETPTNEQWFLPEIYKPHVYERPVPLSSVYHDPALFKAYPEVADLKFGFDRALSNTKTLGYYGPKVTPELYGQLTPETKLKMRPHDYEERIMLNPVMEERKRLGVLSHELQHWIQMKEGFAMGGGSPQRVSPGTPAYKVYQEYYKKLDPEAARNWSPRQLAKAVGDPQPPSKEQTAAFKERLNSMAFRLGVAESLAKREAYKRLLGESEARLAERRGGMSALRQREYFPKLDVPENKQIIRRSYDEPWE